MNRSIMMGRLVKDPDIRHTESRNGELAIANFRLAVDRKYAKENDEAQADFFSCTTFGKTAEFVEKYLVKGMKVAVQGRMQNDHYTNRDGDKVYGVRLIVDDIEFAESKSACEERENGYTEGRGGGRKDTASSGGSRERTGGDTQSRGSGASGRGEQPSRPGNASRYAGNSRKNQNPDDEFMDMDEYAESDMGFH